MLIGAGEIQSNCYARVSESRLKDETRGDLLDENCRYADILLGQPRPSFSTGGFELTLVVISKSFLGNLEQRSLDL